MSTPGIGHNSRAAKHEKYTAAEIDAAIRAKIRVDNIRDDSTFMHRVRWEIWLSNLSLRAKLVGLAIWEHADDDGTKAFPSVDRIRVMVGGSKRDIAAALNEFAAWEFAHVIKGSGRRANEYQFRIPVQTLQELSDCVVVPLRSHNSANAATVLKHYSGTTVVPLEDLPEANCSTAMVPECCGTAMVPQGDSGTTVVPGAAAPQSRSSTVAVPNSPVAVPSHIKNAGEDSLDLPEETTRDSARTREDAGLSKAAAAVAIGITTAVAALPAAAGTEPPLITQPANIGQHLNQLANRLFEAGGAALANCSSLEWVGEVEGWIAQGCDLECDILPIIRARAKTAPPESIRSWGYFRQAVANAKAARLAPMPEGQARPQTQRFDDGWETNRRALEYLKRRKECQ